MHNLKKRSIAAQQVQSRFRGRRNQQNFTKLKTAATKIQSSHRGKQNRRVVASQRGKQVEKPKGSNFGKILDPNVYNYLTHRVMNEKTLFPLSRASKGHWKQTMRSRQKCKARAELETKIRNNEMLSNAPQILQYVSDQTGYAVDWLKTATILEFDIDDSFGIDIRHISVVMSVNRGISNLFIGGLSIDDPDNAALFADALKQQNNRLDTLYFERILFSADCLKLIINALNDVKSLNTLSFEEINFVSNRNTSAFVPIIASCLKVNRSITDLSIKTTPSVDDVNPIGQVLQNNNSLTRLDLGSNRITSEGVKRLAQGLNTNQTLKSLIMDHNRIGKSGGIALAEGLKYNRVLQELNISYNHIPKQLRELQRLNDTVYLTMNGQWDDTLP